MITPFPANESLRLEALYRLKMLDTEPEASFDQITALAAHLYGTSMATITLIDAERQWFKACIGMRDRETSRDIAFCARTILEGDGLLVPDATQDSRFANYPNVTGDPHIRFYAGWPLITSDGFAVGTLCVIDPSPRSQSIDLRPLKDLAAIVSQLLETRHLSNRLLSAELAREDAEQNYRSIVADMRQIAFQIDADGRWKFLNPAWTKVMGISLEATLGQPWITAVHPEDLERARVLWQKLSLERKQFRDDLRFTDRNGAVVWIEVIARSSWDAESNLSGVSGTLHDFTERRQNEELLMVAKADADKAQQTAEAASKSKSAFVASVSHEIRTPLNAILGMAEVLAETNLTAEQSKYVEVFRRAGMNLLGLINDVLDFSKIEAGRIELETIELDVHTLVQQTLELIRPRTQVKGILLSHRVSPEVPRRLLGDPVRLQQILMNLLSNAVKFTDHGEISLEVMPASPNMDGHLKFEVRDSGIGIPSHKLANIFEDFEQADSSTTRKYGGTGLGLGIVRRLISMMNGSIAVESIPGTGSIFSFTVSLCLPETAPSQQRSGGNCQAAQCSIAPESIGNHKGKNILIAEDSIDNQAVLEAFLAGSGHSFTFAQNGQHALTLFETSLFDLILMDVQMPILDGLEATRRVRLAEASLNRPRTPVIMLTANALGSDIEASTSVGADGHLSKPISKQRLLAAIQEFTSSTAATPSKILVDIPEGFESLMPEYLARRKAELIHLQRLAGESDFATIQQIAHNLKGTGAAYGFDPVTSIGSALEAAAIGADLRRLASALSELSTYLGSVEVRATI